MISCCERRTAIRADRQESLSRSRFGSAEARLRESFVLSCRLFSGAASTFLWFRSRSEVQQTVDPAFYFCTANVSPSNALECPVPLSAWSHPEVQEPQIREDEAGRRHAIDIPPHKELFQRSEGRLAAFDDLMVSMVSDCLSLRHGIYCSRPKDLRADSPKVKPLRSPPLK